MRKQILLIAAFIITCFGYSAHAQVKLEVNIGTQPVWGPTGYDHASYYYLPDVDAYYDVNARQYVYMEGSAWVTRPNLPPRYANYDLYHGYKAVINEPTPWLHHDRYRAQYAKYKGRHDQKIIRDSHEDKYRANPAHPEHNQWHGNAHQPHQVQTPQHDDHHGNDHHDNDHHDNDHHGR